jgi:hypothetical protein
MKLSNPYVRLILYGIMASLVFIILSMILEKWIFGEYLIAPIYWFIYYLTLFIFGIFFLNRLSHNDDSSYIQQVNFFGLYNILYVLVTLFIINLVEIFLLVPNGYTISQIAKSNFAQAYTFFYIIFSDLIYVKFKIKFQKIKWIV